MELHNLLESIQVEIHYMQINIETWKWTKDQVLTT